MIAHISYSSSNRDVATIDQYGAITLEGVGKTTIAATAAPVNSKYAETKISYELTVTKKPAKVKISNDTRTYFESNPEFKYEVVGLDGGAAILDKNASKQAVQMEITTDAHKLSDVGSNYTITGRVLGSKNYDITEIIDGTLTITKLPKEDDQNITVKALKNKAETVIVDIQPLFPLIEIEDIEIINNTLQSTEGIIVGSQLRRHNNTSVEFLTESKDSGSAQFDVKVIFKN